MENLDQKVEIAYSGTSAETIPNTSKRLKLEGVDDVVLETGSVYVTPQLTGLKTGSDKLNNNAETNNVDNNAETNNDGEITSFDI